MMITNKLFQVFKKFISSKAIMYIHPWLAPMSASVDDPPYVGSAAHSQATAIHSEPGGNDH